jgi:hypothetical protein
MDRPPPDQIPRVSVWAGIARRMGVMESKALCEASQERMWQHHRDREFVILTAWRKDRSLDDNVAALEGLKRQIRDAGYAFIQLDGVGEGGSGLVAAGEPSLLVCAREGRRPAGGVPLLAHALEWARAPGGKPEHRQDHLFYADGAGGAAVLAVSRDAGRPTVEDFTPATLGRFYGKLQLGMTFQGAWAGLKYADPPSGWIEGMGRESQGELFGYCETLDELVQTLRRGPSRG